MRTRLPPTEQIEAFILAARAPSFRAAAAQCALSEAAFSRRIQAFAHCVNLTLFTRTATGARLTPAGERCLALFEPAYLELRRAAELVAEDEGAAATVTVALSHSLAVGWFIPRLAGFQRAHPEITIEVRTDRTPDSLRSGHADLALSSSDNDLEGLISEPLLPVAVGPVAAPDYAESMRRRGADLSDERLLAYQRPPQLWNWWGKTTRNAVADRIAMRFEIQQALYEAAARGQGVALAIGPTIIPFLESGRLVRLPFPAVPYPGGEYRLVRPRRATRRLATSKVMRWLQAEAGLTPMLT